MINFQQFCLVAAIFLDEEDEGQVREELRQALRLYDKATLDIFAYQLQFITCMWRINNGFQDGRGFITTNILLEILSEIDSELTENDLDQIIEEVDEFHTGTLTFEHMQKNKYFGVHIFLTFQNFKR